MKMLARLFKVEWQLLLVMMVSAVLIGSGYAIYEHGQAEVESGVQCAVGPASDGDYEAVYEICRNVVVQGTQWFAGGFSMVMLGTGAASLAFLNWIGVIAVSGGTLRSRRELIKGA